MLPYFHYVNKIIVLSYLFKYTILEYFEVVECYNDAMYTLEK